MYKLASDNQASILKQNKKMDREKISKLDEELVAIIKDFLILAPLSWPNEIMKTFLKNIESKNAILPEVSYPKIDYSLKINALQKFIKKIGNDTQPALGFLKDTAESYLDAYNILKGAGTQAVSEYSAKLYGSPQDNLPGYKRRNIDVARYFLRIVEDYDCSSVNDPKIYSAQDLKIILEKRVGQVIDPILDPIHITIDSHIAALATSGPNYVKIREGASFSEADLKQLFHHEVMIHTLTYINGRKQPVLKSLGYASPRTTATQEGLAVFSEYINKSIDLIRLKRIALRILAIDMAEKGANLLDLFKFYKNHGQNNEDSYYSSMRVFRGGTPKGGIIFYKDNVYLKGLIEIGAFLKHATHQGTIHDIALLFSGKLTTQDVIRLHPLIEEGYIPKPSYMPIWATKTSELAAHLAFNDLTERFKLKGIA